MNPHEYIVLISKVKEELNNLGKLESVLAERKLFPRIAATAVGGLPLEDEFVCRAIGSILQDYYTGCENIFEVIARKVDCSLPQGERWHRELLDQMARELPGIRPPVISRQTREKLDNLRKFRHVFNNVYGFFLDVERLRELLTDLPEVSRLLWSDLQSFHLEMVKVIFGEDDAARKAMESFLGKIKS